MKCKPLLIVNKYPSRRHYRLEAELNSMTWRIRADDIIFDGRRGNKPLTNQGKADRKLTHCIKPGCIGCSLCFGPCLLLNAHTCTTETLITISTFW